MFPFLRCEASLSITPPPPPGDVLKPGDALSESLRVKPGNSCRDGPRLHLVYKITYVRAPRQGSTPQTTAKGSHSRQGEKSRVKSR